ncbi:MAG: hypothetical protein AAFR47_21365, partial [Pseudomonadota bacterium]
MALSTIPSVVIYAGDAVSFAIFKSDKYQRDTLVLRIEKWVGSKARDERGAVLLDLEIRRVWFRIPARVELSELRHLWMVSDDPLNVGEQTFVD